MKKSLLLILLFPLLASCSSFFTPSGGEDDEGGGTSPSKPTIYDSLPVGFEIKDPTRNIDTKLEPTSHNVPLSECSSVSIDFSYVSTSYATNFDTFTSGGYEFMVRKYGKTPMLYAGLSKESIYRENGSVSNTKESPFANIYYIKVDYSTSYTQSEMPRLYFGETIDMHNYYEIDKNNTTPYPINAMHYFRFETGNVNINLNEVTIYYKNGPVTIPDISYKSGDNRYRFDNPEHTSLTDGKEALMPLEITSDNKVKSYRRYVYYSLDYVKNNLSDELVNKTTYIDPIDVMNYVQAFGTWPNNFFLNNRDEVEEIYAYSDLRQVSHYTRSTGYVNFVPNRYNDYYELDIDVRQYSLSSRDAGRIVFFPDGLSGYNSNQSACFFTNDHYVTFIEYYNNGTCSRRFDATDYSYQFTNTVHSYPVTISIS